MFNIVIKDTNGDSHSFYDQTIVDADRYSLTFGTDGSVLRHTIPWHSIKSIDFYTPIANTGEKE